MALDETFQASIFPVLVEAFDVHLSSVYSGKMYAFTASPTSTFPKCVYQSQDGGGKSNDFIDANGWKGLITFRSIHTTLSGAMYKLKELSSLFSTVTVSGYTLSIRSRNPLPLPVEKYNGEDLYTIALVAEIEIHKD